MILSYIKSSLAELRDYVELNYEAKPSLSLDVSEDAFLETVVGALQRLENQVDEQALHMKDEIKDQIRFSEDLIESAQDDRMLSDEHTVPVAC